MDGYLEMMEQPFAISVPEEAIDNLRLRLRQTQWPDTVMGSGWAYGVDLDWMKAIAEYWRNQFDWRAQERELNAYPHYIGTIDGFRIHYLHFRSKHTNAVPLIITHGWPGSFLELLKVAPIPANSSSDPFHVVVPSLPGFGFSERPSTAGMNTFRTAELWVKLMRQLGYDRFMAQGGDIGANVSSVMAWKHPDAVLALHLNYIPGSYRPWVDEATQPLRAEEIAFKQRAQTWYEENGGYWHVQATQPQTLGFALNDSPIGLAAWLIDKYRAWSDCDGVVERRFSRDELLTHVSLYWFTETIASSCRMYLESRRAPLAFGPDERIVVPCGVLHLAKEEPMPPRTWAERAYSIVRWTEKPAGGHFAAWEEPELFATDVREFAAP
ncbi:MAG: epoxide hydrolase family protein, partial [Gemmatimonadaceae bacterium]